MPKNFEIIKNNKRIFKIYKEIKNKDKNMDDENALNMAITMALDDIKTMLISKG